MFTKLKGKQIAKLLPVVDDICQHTCLTSARVRNKEAAKTPILPLLLALD